MRRSTDAGLARLLPVLLLLPGLLPAEPVEHGRRVTINAVDQPLESILLDLAKQLNCRFNGYVTDRGPSMRELQTLQLTDAGMPQLRAALWDLTGATMTRTARTNWLLNIAREMPPEPLAVRVGGGSLRLDWLRFYYYRYLWPADPANDQQVSLLTPSFSYEADDDVAALRLLGFAESGASTAEGEPLGMRQKGPATATPVATDPALYTLVPSLDAPGPEVKRLAELWLDLRFAGRLEASDFVFEQLGSRESQRLRQDGVTAVLSAFGEGEAPTLATVAIAQPVPPAWDTKLDLAVLRREGWLEPQFYDATGQPLLTEARLVSLDTKSLEEQRWVTRWQISVLNQPWVGRPPTELSLLPAVPTPAKLVLRCYRPVGKPVIERATFSDLPLPPREGDLPW